MNEDIERYYMAGQRFLKVGSRENAMMMVSVIRELAPGHPLASELLAQIYGVESDLLSDSG